MSQPSLSSLIKQEISVLREKYLFAVDDTLQDPVFEGMVRDFASFHDALSAMFSRINRVTISIESMSTELIGLSETLQDRYKGAVPGDHMITSDSYKFREASNQIGRADAPHSSLAKFKRDLDYNVLGPLRSHLTNCRQLQNVIELRNRKLVELSACERNMAASPEARVVAHNLRQDFEQIDKHVFDWFMMLEEHKGDILDSLMQTLKYLEYEFFATSAHAIAAVLPARMEFRPMVEMVPKQLEIQLGVERKAEKELGEDPVAENDPTPVLTESDLSAGSGYVGSGQRGLSDYSKRLLQKSPVGSPSSSGNSGVVVDILSLSSLLSQGFDEGPARKALRECNNDTQAALEWLLNGHRRSAEAPSVSAGTQGETEENVRMPTTLSRLKRIKELKQRLQEKKLAKQQTEIPREGAVKVSVTETVDDLLGPSDFTSEEYKTPLLPQTEDLLFQ